MDVVFRRIPWIVNEIVLIQAALDDDILIDIEILAKNARQKIVSFVMNDPRSILEIGASKEIDADKIKNFLLNNCCHHGFEIEEVALFRAYPKEYLVFLKHWFVYATDWQSAVYEEFSLPLETKYLHYLEGFKNTKMFKNIGMTFDIFEAYINRWGLNNTKNEFWLTEERKAMRRKYYD